MEKRAREFWRSVHPEEREQVARYLSQGTYRSAVVHKRGRRFFVYSDLIPVDGAYYNPNVAARWGRLEEVILGDTYLLDSNCTCGAGVSPGGVCRHAAAASAEFARRDRSTHGGACARSTVTLDTQTFRYPHLQNAAWVPLETLEDLEA